MKKKYTIAMCGGHITPALAVIEALRGDASIVFFGRKYAMEGSSIPSFEYRLITEINIRFISITAGRLHRYVSRHTILSFFKFPVGCIQAMWYCVRIRPSLIVSFGGYVALPVAIAAWFCRIPVITHEQTLVPGLANRIIARIARRVCVTFPETLSYFPKDKAVVTGLPMRRELFSPSKAEPFTADLPHYPLIYVTGGGTGAQSLNRLLFPILPDLLKKYTIVHQVGDASLAEAQKIRSDRYIVASHFSLATVSWILAHASLVVGRAGANTVLETAALGKVALFVPLPWSGGGEQEKNALWLAHNGGAVVLHQRGLASAGLMHNIREIFENLASLQSRADVFAQKIPRDGAGRMRIEIEHILSAP